jgi:hypothetical protein
MRSPIRNIRIVFLLIAIVATTGSPANAQNGFLLLQKNNRTTLTYFSGSEIGFTTKTGTHHSGRIMSLKNDSLLLKVYSVFPSPDFTGKMDTLTKYYLPIPVSDIAYIDRTGRRFNWQASGAALLGGGTLLVLAGGVSWMVDREKFSPALLVASAALAATGYLLMKKGDRPIRLGKKYTLQYVENRPPSP